MPYALRDPLAIRLTGLKRWLVAALLLAAGAAQALELDSLMKLLAQVKTGEATFTERRVVTQLERTLESSGG